MSTPQSAAPMHALEEHRSALAGRTLTELFAADADRFSRLSLSWMTTNVRKESKLAPGATCTLGPTGARLTTMAGIKRMGPMAR